jgi:hypothetical protein
MKHGGRISTHTEARQHEQHLKHLANLAELRERKKIYRASGLVDEKDKEPHAFRFLREAIFGHRRR